MERKGIIAAGNMLVDHVHQIGSGRSAAGWWKLSIANAPPAARR